MNGSSDKETELSGVSPDQESNPELSPDAEIFRLAALNRVAYDQARVSVAKTLGIRVSTLDEEVAKLRVPADRAEASGVFDEPEPWPDPVDAAAILDEVVATICRFCVLPDWAAEAIALWIAHAHTHDSAMISPILTIVSPAPRCGKTTVLSVVSVLVPKSMMQVSVTPAVLFRVVEHHKPTVLIDEGDTFLRDNEDLRGLLNGGHNRLIAHVWRCDGDDHEPRRFTVWAPKAIAMIGRPPETLEDRSVMVPLRRKGPRESVERFRSDKLEQFIPLRRKLARLALDISDVVREADPDVPESLNDRAQDNWRTPLAIADSVGGHWPDTARQAAIALSARAEADAEESAPLLLLRDIQTILDGHEAMASSDLLARLIALDEAPWATWRGGQPISSRKIVLMLKCFDIRPRRVNSGSEYRAADFEDAWARYLSEDPLEPATSATSATCHPSATANPLEIHDPLQNDGSGRSDDVAEGTVTNRYRRTTI